MMAAILTSTMLDWDTAILDSTPSYLLSDSLKNTLTPLWLWLKLIQSDSNCFIFTYLHDGGHLEFGHLGLSNLCISFQIHSHLPRLVPTICIKHFTHSFCLNLMMAAILKSAILKLAILDSALLVFSFKLTHTCQDFSHHLHKTFHSFILTQLDNGSHLDFHHVGLRHCHLGFRHLVIFLKIHSETLSLYSNSDSN